MGSYVTSVRLKKEQEDFIKQFKINVSQLLDKALEQEKFLLSKDNDPLKFLEAEKERLVSSYNLTREKFEKEIAFINEKIKLLESQREQIESIRNHPIVLESVQILKDNGLKFMDGRIRLIKAKTGFDISETQLLAWTNEVEP